MYHLTKHFFTSLVKTARVPGLFKSYSKFLIYLLPSRRETWRKSVTVPSPEKFEGPCFTRFISLQGHRTLGLRPRLYLGIQTVSSNKAPLKGSGDKRGGGHNNSNFDRGDNALAAYSKCSKGIIAEATSSFKLIVRYAYLLVFKNSKCTLNGSYLNI